MAGIITISTLILLLLAALILAFQVIKQERAGQLSPWNFSSFLLIVLIGWVCTEVVVDTIGVSRSDLLRVTHFGVMVLVAATMTLQLKRSLKK